MTGVVRDGAVVRVGERVEVDFGRGNQQLAQELEWNLRRAHVTVLVDGEPA